MPLTSYLHICNTRSRGRNLTRSKNRGQRSLNFTSQRKVPSLMRTLKSTRRRTLNISKFLLTMNCPRLIIYTTSKWTSQSLVWRKKVYVTSVHCHPTCQDRTCYHKDWKCCQVCPRHTRSRKPSSNGKLVTWLTNGPCGPRCEISVANSQSTVWNHSHRIQFLWAELETRDIAALVEQGATWNFHCATTASLHAFLIGGSTSVRFKPVAVCIMSHAKWIDSRRFSAVHLLHGICTTVSCVAHLGALEASKRFLIARFRCKF